MDIISAAAMLFLIMDPLGNLPVFLSILRSLPKARRRKVMVRELLISLVVMLLFLYAGQEILNLLNLKQEAVSIAGGIVLFLIALRMIFPSEGGVTGLPEGGRATDRAHGHPHDCRPVYLGGLATPGASISEPDDRLDSGAAALLGGQLDHFDVL